MRDEIDDDDAELEEEAADEQHTINEIKSILAQKHKAVFDDSDPVMVLVTLSRILQKEARRDMRRSLNHYDSLLRQTLTDIFDSAHDREVKILNQTLKYLDEIGKRQADVMVKNGEITLKSALKSALMHKLLPEINKKFTKFYIICWTCLGTSLLLLLSILVKKFN